MNRKSKRTILLIGSIAAILSLTRCDVVTVLTSEFFFPPEIIELPMGEGKTVSYTINSWVKKPYLMILGFESEHQEYSKAFNENLDDIPYNFSVKCYEIKKDMEILFFEKKYTIKSFHGVRGWNSQNPKNLNTWGGRYSLGGFDLPYGQYRCDLKDESQEKIKTFLKKAGVVKTAFQILPYKLWFY